MEANSFPGRTIRWLAPMADRIFLSFPNSFQWFSRRLQRRCILSGNPIRPSLLHNPPDPAEAKRRWGFNPTLPLVLVLGGSLGARSLNEAIASIVPQLIQHKIQVLWQTGKQTVDTPLSSPLIVPTDFIDDMQAAYQAADLVVSRAGASAVAEIAAFGKPAIFVPYPAAVHRHQHHNVAALVRHQAALFLEDHQLKEQLLPLIRHVLRHASLREQLAQNIRQFARPDAAEVIAKDLEKFLP